MLVAFFRENVNEIFLKISLESIFGFSHQGEGRKQMERRAKEKAMKTIKIISDLIWLYYER